MPCRLEPILPKSVAGSDFRGCLKTNPLIPPLPNPSPARDEGL